jgi:hypothetical protein
MRPVTRTYEVFPIEELNTAAQEKAYHNWLENGDYAWASENRETLEAFCDIFNVDCRFWEYDAYSHNFHYSTRHSGNIESLKGQRLATYITNNYWAPLYPPKQYWKNGEKRESRIFNEQNYSLTGYYLDAEILQPLWDFLENPYGDMNFKSLLGTCLENFFIACSDDMADAQSEDNFKNESGANSWEYLSNGKLFN